MISSHQTERKLKCTVGSCDFSTIHFRLLKIHRFTHLEKFKCEFCDLETHYRRHLAKHNNSFHNHSEKYKCFLCNRIFATLFNVHQHFRNDHKRKIRKFDKKCFELIEKKSSEKFEVKLREKRKPKNEVGKREKEVKFLEAAQNEIEECE